MKKTFISVLLAVSVMITCGQEIQTATAPITIDYLRKSKNQNTAAWILTSAGTVAIVAAFLHDLNNILTDANSLTGLYIAGGAMIGSGIILFSAAAKNKRKAATSTVSFNTRFIMEKSMVKTNRKNFPAVGISISF